MLRGEGTLFLLRLARLDASTGSKTGLFCVEFIALKVASTAALICRASCNDEIEFCRESLELESARLPQEEEEEEEKEDIICVPEKCCSLGLKWRLT